MFDSFETISYDVLILYDHVLNFLYKHNEISVIIVVVLN